MTKGLMHLARRLPRDTGFRLFSAVGAGAGRVLRRDRERAMTNLATAFPEAPGPVREAMATAMFKTLGMNVFEFLRLEGSSAERVQSLVERVDGMDHFVEAYERSRGVLAVTGHIGCWELLAAYFSSLGYPTHVIGRELWEKRLNRELLRIRESVGCRTIDRDSGGRDMLRALRGGEVIGVLMDQNTRVSGIHVPFFNRPAHTPVGVAKLSLATGATLVPMAIYMIRAGKHAIRVLPPLEQPPGALDKTDRVQILTERCNRAIEELIRYDPKQWVWFHDRWGIEDGVYGHAVVN